MPYNPNVADHEIIPTGIKLSRYGPHLRHNQAQPEYAPPARANPVALTLLAGAEDAGSPLCVLSGHGDVLCLIFEAVRAVWASRPLWWVLTS